MQSPRQANVGAGCVCMADLFRRSQVNRRRRKRAARVPGGSLGRSCRLQYINVANGQCPLSASPGFKELSFRSAGDAADGDEGRRRGEVLLEEVEAELAVVWAS